MQTRSISANTLLEIETLDIDMIRQLIENGKIEPKKKHVDSDEGPHGGSEATTTTTPSAEDVKVNIQPQNGDHESNKLGFDKEVDHNDDGSKS
jgi:hypothetical protein